MPTTISTPSNADAKIRFQEQYVSEGLNKKLNGVAPAGILRGGKLTTNASPLTVTVEADPESGDSVFSYIDASGHQITYRVAGNVNLSLSGVAGTDVYIALYVSYAIGTPTVVEWRAYTIAELTTAPVPEADYVVVLGRVNVPASGVIADTSILPELRREAAFVIPEASREWRQMLVNSDFELAPGGGADLSAQSTSVVGWGDSFLGSGYTVFCSETAPLVGSHELEFRADGLAVPSSSALRSFSWVRVDDGEFARVACDIRGSSWTAMGANGFFGLEVLWYDKDFAFISSERAAGIDSSYSGTFSYTRFEKILKAPANARWANVAITIDTDGVTPTAGASVFIDNAKLWAKPKAIDLDSQGLDNGAVGGDVAAGSFLIGPKPGVAASWQEQINSTVRTKGLFAVPNFGDLIAIIQEGLLGDPSTNPVKGFLKQVVDGFLAFSHTQDSQSVRELPYIGTYSYDSGGLAGKDLIVRHSWGNGIVQTDVGSVRLYTSSVIHGGILRPGFEISFNAYYDTTGGQWVREQSGVDSWLIVINDDGVSFYTKESAAASWADGGWQESSLSPLIGIPMSGGLANREIGINGVAASPASLSIASFPRSVGAANGWVSASGVDVLSNTIVKAHGQITLDDAGAIVSATGWNYTALVSGNSLVISFVDVLASADYTVVGSVSDDALSQRDEFVSFSGLLATGFTLNQFDSTGTNIVFGSPGSGRKYSFIVFGE